MLRYGMSVLALYVGGMSVVSAADVDFGKDVAPIFRQHCSACHNGRDAEGGLILESHAQAMRGGEHGAAIVAGNSAESVLYRVVAGQAEPKMPPEDAPPLSQAELDILRRWIDAGANAPQGGPGLAGLVTPRIEPRGATRKPVVAIAASDDHRWIAVARPAAVEIYEGSHRNAPFEKPVRVLAGHLGAISDVGFSPGSQQLLVAAGEVGLAGELTIWQTSDWSRQHVLSGHRDALYGATSTAGGVVATASYDRDVQVWDLATGSVRQRLVGHNDAVYAVALRPDGQLVASASGDRTIKLWDVATGARLETLAQPAKDQYTVAFSPNGKQLAAAGADLRLRLWDVSTDGREGTNPLRYARFAHEGPILKLAFSPDGTLLATSSEDRRIKLWETKTLTQSAVLERQPDWSAALAFRPDSNTLLVGRMNGDVAEYPLAADWRQAKSPGEPLLSSREAQGQSPNAPLPEAMIEPEPNDRPAQATPLTLPGKVAGAFATNPGGDVDLYRISVQAGETWLLETHAASRGSQADTNLEVLHPDGRPVLRGQLQAVRDSWITFRPIDSTSPDVRVEYWEEMDLNQYLYMSGEVCRLFRAPQGPDSGYQLYNLQGRRRGYFETSAIAHAKEEPVYIVEAYEPGSNLVDNGLPVFPLYYRNDDDAERERGTDSRLTFTAATTGDYLIRVTDTRSTGGEKHTYELTARSPKLDFNVRLENRKLKVNAGSGKRIKFIVDRRDGFEGPIRIDVAGLPAGYTIASPIWIERGQLEATAAVCVTAEAASVATEELANIVMTATANLAGAEQSRSIASFEELAVEAAPKIVVRLEPDDPRFASNGGGLVIEAGTTITAKVLVDRHGFEGDVKFDVDSLPHGIIVDNIGLSGILVRSGETERQVFLTCRPWVPETTHWISAVSQNEGNQASRSIPLTVRSPRTLAER